MLIKPALVTIMSILSYELFLKSKIFLHIQKFVLILIDSMTAIKSNKINEYEKEKIFKNLSLKIFKISLKIFLISLIFLTPLIILFIFYKNFFDYLLSYQGVFIFIITMFLYSKLKSYE